MGRNLTNLLNNSIDSMVTDNLSKTDIVESMANSAGIESSTVNQILQEEINCPPLDRLEGFSEALGISLSSVIEAAESDGCDYETERSVWRKLYNELKGIFSNSQPSDESMPESERAISFSQIYEQVWNMTWEHGYLVDVFDESGQMYAIFANNGLLFRQQLSIVDDKVVLAGDPFEVAVDYPAVQTRTTINRQVDGRYRWFSISATSVLNRVGEIDSKALFDSFVSHIEESGEYPIREFYHQGDTFRTGQGDYVARDGNCLITSGIFDDTPLALAEIKSRQRNPNYWGESIGYKPTSQPEMLNISEGISIPVYTTGILREISTLPEKEAANLFTVTNQKEEVSRMLTGRAMDALVEMFGSEDDAQKWLSENAGELNRTIAEKGLINREKPKEEDVIISNVLPVQVDDALIDEIVNRLGQRDAIATLQSELQGVTTALETINTNQGDIVSRLDALQSDANDRFTKLERTKAESLQESIVNLPSVPQVRRYEYTPRQGAKNTQQNNGTMANEASGLKNFY